MGQYWTYFRAKDAAKAKSLTPKGILKDKSADSVSLKAFDHEIRLGQMLAFATSTDWTEDAVQTSFIWPPTPKPETIEDWERLPDNSPWHSTDYFLEEFAQDFRDRLAAIDSVQFQRLLKEWTPNQNFEGFDIDDLRACFRDIVALARRARAANEKLFVCTPNG